MRASAADYHGTAAAPTYDVSAQSPSIQGAYASYREAVNLVTAKVDSLHQLCESGGGGVNRLAFDVARMAINEAGSMLTNALTTLEQ